MISYFEKQSGSFKVAECATIDCAIAISTTVDDQGMVGDYSSIAIGVDGLPIISYLDYNSYDEDGPVSGHQLHQRHQYHGRRLWHLPPHSADRRCRWIAGD